MYSYLHYWSNSKLVYGAGLQETLAGHEGRKELVVCRSEHSDDGTAAGAIPGKYPDKIGTYNLQQHKVCGTITDNA